MVKEVTYQGFDYRVQGGEIQRRPIESCRNTPEQNAWSVLNHGEVIPQVVQNQLALPRDQLRFD